ncbi:ATP-binding protein [Sulfobacillus harzensis]|uniref:ATP-binding protein n=1 Tax=Sulfobacillus harzensis TaxID=2729629 RepID=UPI003B837B52
MPKESCTLCGVSPVVQPSWRKNGRTVCADCLEMAIATLENQPPEAVIPAAPGVLGRLVTLCTFCERRGPHHVLVRTSRGRICDSCINEARKALPAWVFADLRRAWDDNRFATRLAVYTRPKLLCVDEVGYLPLERLDATLFFRLVSARYERGSMILTSNKSFSEWGEVFGDAVLATAILDRLLHRSTVVNIRGDSYRLRDKKRGVSPAGTVLVPPASRTVDAS